MGEESHVAVSCGVGHRHGLDQVLLWLCYRLAAAAPIQPLAWELLCAAGVALTRKKKIEKAKHMQLIPISGINCMSIY